MKVDIEEEARLSLKQEEIESLVTELNELDLDSEDTPQLSVLLETLEEFQAESEDAAEEESDDENGIDDDE